MSIGQTGTARVGDTLFRYGLDLASQAGGNMLREYWPVFREDEPRAPAPALTFGKKLSTTPGKRRPSFSAMRIEDASQVEEARSCVWLTRRQKQEIEKLRNRILFLLAFCGLIASASAQSNFNHFNFTAGAGLGIGRGDVAVFCRELFPRQCSEAAGTSAACSASMPNTCTTTSASDPA